MTVGEMIKNLQQYDKDLPVVVEDRNCTYTGIDTIHDNYTTIDGYYLANNWYFERHGYQKSDTFKGVCLTLDD